MEKPNQSRVENDKSGKNNGEHILNFPFYCLEHTVSKFVFCVLMHGAKFNILLLRCIGDKK